MENIIIYPENTKQISLLTSLFEEMKIRFEIKKEDILLTEEEFNKKIGQSLQEYHNGETTLLAKNNQKQFLGL